jgi:cytoplasmic iron level regulating protein YaaA (DUF328/UPF0246 family)
MLFLLSPAKSLDYDTPLTPAQAALQPTQPAFLPQAAELVGVLKRQTPSAIAGLMHLSDKLASLNAARYTSWRRSHSAKNARAAALAFDGDVYAGLDARTLDTDTLQWADAHICILSGLYGALRPLDWLQPYRLEMGTRLANARGADLYAFWGDRIARHLNQRLAADVSPVVVNLASQEYFRAVDTAVLRARVVECVFQDWSAGQYKIVSFFAKRARGLMARWAAEHRVLTPSALQGFDADGYAFAAAESSPERLVFRRQTKG